MILRILALLLLLPVCAFAAQTIPVVPSADGLRSKARITSSYTVNDFSDPINSCLGMTVTSQLGRSSEVSVYSTDVDDVLLADIRSSAFVGTISGSSPSLETFTPTKQQVRLVVETQSTSGRLHSGVVIITCDPFVPGLVPTFYGLPSHFGADTVQMMFDFNYKSDVNYIQPPLPTLDTGLAALDPWRTIYSQAPTGTLGEIKITNTTDGTVGLEWFDDIIDNTAMNVTSRGTTMFLNSLGFKRRQAAYEFRVGFLDPDDMDVFIGVCSSAESTLIQTDGTLASTTFTGFHWLRTDADSFPDLVTDQGDVTPLATPTIPVLVDDGTVFEGFTLFAVKFLDDSNMEWYINRQMVGKTTLATPLLFEQHICMGMTTTSTGGSTMWVDHVRWVVDKLQVD